MAEIQLTPAETIAALRKEVIELNFGRIGLLAYQDKLIATILNLQNELKTLKNSEEVQELDIGE